MAVKRKPTVPKAPKKPAADKASSKKAATPKAPTAPTAPKAKPTATPRYVKPKDHFAVRHGKFDLAVRVRGTSDNGKTYHVEFPPFSKQLHKVKASECERVK